MDFQEVVTQTEVQKRPLLFRHFRTVAGMTLKSPIDRAKRKADCEKGETGWLLRERSRKDRGTARTEPET